MYAESMPHSQDCDTGLCWSAPAQEATDSRRPGNKRHSSCAEYNTPGQAVKALRMEWSSDCINHLDSDCCPEDLLCTRSDSSVDTELCCDEGLDAPAGRHSLESSVPSCSTSTWSTPCRDSASTPPSSTLEVCEMLRNELRREASLRHQGSVSTHAPSTSSVPPSMRTAAAGWLVEVAGELGLQQETLFQAVSLLDRYLAAPHAPIQGGMLQLVALACMSLAAKQEEVEQITAADWATVADDCFTQRDLKCMEWLVLETLDWRVRSPTPYSFLHLYCHGLACCSALTICTASYLAELSLLDGTLQAECTPSTIAAAAILLSQHSTTGGHSALALHALAPFDDTAVRGCAGRLVQLQQDAVKACSETSSASAPIYSKYSTAGWHHASLAAPPQVAI